MLRLSFPGSLAILILLGPVSADEPKLLEGHKDAINAVAFSPDGRQIATGSSDQTVRFWDPASGKLLRQIANFPGSITDLAFTADGSRLATCAYDTRGRKAGEWAGLVQVWDTGTGKEIRAFPLEQSQEAVRVRQIGLRLSQRVLAGGKGGVVRVWDVESGKEVFALKGHTGTVRALAVSADGTLLASASEDGTTCLWDGATGKQKATLKQSALPVLTVAFAPDRKLLVTGGVDRIARVWDVTSGKEVRKVAGHSGPILAVAVNADGKLFATVCGLDRSVRLWDLKSGAEVRKIAFTEKDSPYRAVFSPNGKQLAVGCFDGVTRLFDLTGN